MTEAKPAREESATAVVNRFYEVGVNQRNWEIAIASLAPDFTHNGVVLGQAGQRRRLEALYAAFPDVTVTIETTVAVAGQVVTRMSWTGTQAGPIFGLPATGRRATWAAISIIGVVDGRIAEAWVTEDDLGLARQLGGMLTAGVPAGPGAAPAAG